MKAVRLVAGFAAVLVLAGCGGSEQAAATKTVMPKVEGKQLDVALSDIKRAGFEEEVEVVGGGTFGVVDESNWTVCEQTPAAGKAIKDAPRVVVDRSCPDDSTATSSAPTESEETTAPPTTAPATTTTTPPEPALPAVLTPDNNAGLASLLTEPDNCSDKMRNFAFQYAGKVIEFDGNIADVAPHEGYDTRFDFLVVGGDFSTTTQTGPTFQFQDKNAFDLNLTGSNVPDSITAGLNVRIKAEVGEYNPTTCLFQLSPVSTQVR